MSEIVTDWSNNYPDAKSAYDNRTVDVNGYTWIYQKDPGQVEWLMWMAFYTIDLLCKQDNHAASDLLKKIEGLLQENDKAHGDAITFYYLEILFLESKFKGIPSAQLERMFGEETLKNYRLIKMIFGKEDMITSYIESRNLFS